MSTDELKQLGDILHAIADGAEWECQWEERWGHPNGRDVEYCIANRIAIRLKPFSPFEENCQMIGADLTDETAYHEKVNEVLKAAYSIATNPHVNLGDLVYKIRDSADGNWNAPEVISWSDAVAMLNSIFSDYRKAQKS